MEASFGKTSCLVRQGDYDKKLMDCDTVTAENEDGSAFGPAPPSRPDRITEVSNIAIPEAWRGSARMYDSHRAQIGNYFILHVEQYPGQVAHRGRSSGGRRRGPRVYGVAVRRLLADQIETGEHELPLGVGDITRIGFVR